MPKSRAPFAAASAPARITARPPLAWRFSMKTPWRVASRTAAPTVFGMSWYFRSMKTRKPRFLARSIAAGPAAVKSCEPILQPVTSPSRRASSDSASSRLGTSSATSKRSAALGETSVILLQALDAVLALQQGLDRADGGLRAVERRVMRDVLGNRRPADDGRVPPGPTVGRRVDDARAGALAPGSECDPTGPVG